MLTLINALLACIALELSLILQFGVTIFSNFTLIGLSDLLRMIFLGKYPSALIVIFSPIHCQLLQGILKVLLRVTVVR